MMAERLGDRAILIRESGLAAPSVEAAKAVWPNLTDVVEAFGTLAFYFESEPPTADSVAAEIVRLGATTRLANKTHTVPICYEFGADIESASNQLNLQPETLIKLHSDAEYRVEAIGFSPGFPYLSGLPAELQGLSRLPSPRQRVDPGSIGIVEDLCCIYPDPTPGGWNLIGRTPIRIVDLDEDFFRFEVGDLIRFEPIGEEAFHSWAQP